MDALNSLTRVEAIIIYDSNGNTIVQQINDKNIDPNSLYEELKANNFEEILSYKQYIICTQPIDDCTLAVVGNDSANDIILAQFAVTLSDCIMESLQFNDYQKLISHTQDLYILFDEAVSNGFIVETNQYCLQAKIQMNISDQIDTSIKGSILN